MKILHISNWYPSIPTPQSAPWIRDQIKSLQPFVNHQKIYHVEIRKGRFALRSGTNDDGSSYVILFIPFVIWKLNEILSFLMVLKVIYKNKLNSEDILNFHIAYPNCAYIHMLKKVCRNRILITEHWSGYHFNFNIQDPRKRKRIQRIFHHHIPVITVSRSLLEDIRSFSEADFPGYVVSNSIDTDCFRFANTNPDKDLNFFMLSQWQWPKDPFTAVRAFKKVLKLHPNVKMRIGGYGPQYDRLKSEITRLDLLDHIDLIGVLTTQQVATEMAHAVAFVHCSEYETFSVVCAEALCCGVPVIASAVGGIPEYIHPGNGFLVAANTAEAFSSTIIEFINKKKTFDRKTISEEATDRFSFKVTGEKYFNALIEIISD